MLVIESMDYSLCLTARCKWEIFLLEKSKLHIHFLTHGCFFLLHLFPIRDNTDGEDDGSELDELDPIHLHLLPLIMVGNVLSEVLGYSPASFPKTALWQRRDCSLWKTVSAKAVCSTKQCKCKHFMRKYFTSMYMNISFILSSLWT